MTSAKDYLESVQQSLASAKQCIAAIGVAPFGDPKAYEAACWNPADRTELANAYMQILDAEDEVSRALQQM